MKKTWVTLAYWLLITAGAGAQALTIYCEDSPPFEMAAADGALTGMAVDLVRAIQEKVRNQDPIQLVPWARGYAAIQTNPNTVLFAMTRTKVREPLFQWVGPIHETVFAFYAKSGTTIKIGSLDEAKRVKAIGVYSQDVRDQYLTSRGFTNLIRVFDNELNLKKLAAGQIDLFVASRSEIGPEAQAAGLPAEEFTEVMPFLRVQNYIAFSLKTPPEVVQAWAEAFQSLKKDGSFERIYHRYLPSKPLPGPEFPPQ